MFCCCYCEARNPRWNRDEGVGKWQKDANLRTLGSIRKNCQDFVEDGPNAKAMDHMSAVHQPLLKGPDNIAIIDLVSHFWF